MYAQVHAMCSSNIVSGFGRSFYCFCAFFCPSDRCGNVFTSSSSSIIIIYMQIERLTCIPKLHCVRTSVSYIHELQYILRANGLLNCANKQPYKLCYSLFVCCCCFFLVNRLLCELVLFSVHTSSSKEK